MKHPVSVEINGAIGWITIDSPPVNATSTAVRAGLLQAITDVDSCDLAILRCAGKTFVAGGDMSEFDAPPQLPHLPDVVDAIEASPVPFLAILHGSVLGGGFEIAMACTFRIAKPGTRFGLPEVNVGLVPGAGGSQRAPRLVGWQAAVDMACLGQMKTAEDLAALGAIDQISDSPEDEVHQFVGRFHQPVSKRQAPKMPALDAFEGQIQRAAKGREGPAHNLTALTWAQEPYALSQPKERALHLRLRQSRESRALRHVFFAERAASRLSTAPGREQGTKPDTKPKQVTKVAVVGGGLMGCGIAAACLNAGHRVHLIDRDATMAAKARETVETLLQAALERGKLSVAQFTDRLTAVTTSDNAQDVADADLAIEAVFEDLGAKQAVFATLSGVMRPDAILATNTSYLNPNDIFDGIPNPERCLGLHFFSPAHIMKLVEVIATSQTSDQTLASGFVFAKGLRKTPVLAGICDGFIGNRILASYRRAAEYLLADGALPAQVDRAMQAFGMAMGPFEAQDQAGLQIAEANRRRQDASRDPQERYVAISDQLCAASRYGKRSGAGWYRYETGNRTPLTDPWVTELITQYSAKAGLTRKPMSDADIQMQLLAAMANEGARIIEEGIAETAASIDVIKTAGYGFPRHRGGPMFWADEVGLGSIRTTLNQMDATSPNSWVRAQRFSNQTP